MMDYEEFIKKYISKKAIIDSKEYLYRISDKEQINDMLIFCSLFVLVYEYFQDSLIQNLKDLFYDDFDEMFKPTEKNYINRIVFWYEENNCINEKDKDFMKKLTNRRNDFSHTLINEIINGITDQDFKLFQGMLILEKKVKKWWYKFFEIQIIWREDWGDIDTFLNDEKNLEEHTYSILDLLLDVINSEDNKYHVYIKDLYSRILE